MKSIMTTSGLIVCCFVASTLLAEETKVDPSGTWRWQYEFQDQTRDASLKLNMNDKSEIDGQLVLDGNELDVSKASFKDDTLLVEAGGNYEGSAFTLRYTGKIEGDNIAGDGVLGWDGGQYDFTWKAARSVKMGDVVGTWKLEIAAPDGNVLTPVLKISQDGDGKKLVGEYKSEYFPNLTVENLKLEKNDLILKVVGQDLTVEYKARAYGEKMKGTLEYDISGNTGEAEFAASRKKAAEKSE